MERQTEHTHWNAIAEIMDDFDVAMLTTIGGDGALHGRPMYIVDRPGDGRLVFLSGYQAEKVDEILSDPRAMVTLQTDGRYVALSGKVDLTRNEERIAHLWQPRLSLWFPQGPADPSLTLIDFFPQRGEYWNMRGVGGMRFAWEALKAHLRGQPLDELDSANVHGRAQVN